MTTTYKKFYNAKDREFSIFNHYLIFGFNIWSVCDYSDDYKTGFSILNAGDTHYIMYTTKKRMYSFMIRFGKYDPSVSCCGG